MSSETKASSISIVKNNGTGGAEVRITGDWLTIRINAMSSVTLRAYAFHGMTFSPRPDSPSLLEWNVFTRTGSQTVVITDPSPHNIRFVQQAVMEALSEYQKLDEAAEAPESSELESNEAESSDAECSD